MTDPAADRRTPSRTRMYDLFLCGKDGYDADRAEASRIEAAFGPPAPGHLPAPREMALRGRLFIDRAVSWASRQGGISQFLDLGSGYPAAGRVIPLPSSDEVTHEIMLRGVHEAARDGGPARVAYVDIDPVAVSHTAAFAADGRNVIAVQGDLSDPGAILGDLAVLPGDPVAGGFLDFRQPVCVILGSVLQQWTAADAAAITGAYVDAVAPGSVLIVSVPRIDGDQLLARVSAAYRAGPFSNHTAAEVESFFAGTELLPPGVVPARGWNGGWGSWSRNDGPAYMLAGLGIRR